MALVASRTTNGFEVVRHLFGFNPNPRQYELTPGVAFRKGDLVVLSAGKVAKASAGATNVLGVMAEDVPLESNPTGKTTYGYVFDDPFLVFRCSFTGHRDATATGGSTTTLVDTALPTSADNVWNGALLYVYDGPGAGAVRTVKAYTGATDTLQVEEPFPRAITNQSKYILLGAASAVGDVINVGSIGVNVQNERLINAGGSVASEAGPLAVLAIYPKDLMMDVLIRKHRFNSP